MNRKISTAVIMLIFVMLFLPGCAESPDIQSGQKPTVKYPSRQVNLVIQSSADEFSDSMARAVGIEAQKNLGVPVVFISKPDLSGIQTMSYIKNSEPDGYTIGYVSEELAMVRALGYAPDIDPGAFDLIASSNISAAAIAVNAESPFKTLKDFIDYAKVNPEKLKIGSSGAASIWHIAAVSLSNTADVRFNHIGFDGFDSVIAALKGGKIDAVSAGVMDLKPEIDKKKLRVLAVLSDQRLEYIPIVPTAKESGYDVNVAAWGGFAAPKGLPKDVKNILYPALGKAINSQAVKDIAKDRGVSVFFKDSDDFLKYANSQYEFYMKQIPEMGPKK